MDLGRDILTKIIYGQGDINLLEDLFETFQRKEKQIEIMEIKITQFGREALKAENIWKTLRDKLQKTRDENIEINDQVMTISKQLNSKNINLEISNKIITEDNVDKLLNYSSTDYSQEERKIQNAKRVCIRISDAVKSLDRDIIKQIDSFKEIREQLRIHAQ